MPGAQGSLDFPYDSLKFLQGAQRCTGFYTHHLKVAFKDAIGLPEKETHLISSPAIITLSLSDNPYFLSKWTSIAFILISYVSSFNDYP